MFYQCLLHEGESFVTQEVFDDLHEAVINQVSWKFDSAKNKLEREVHHNKRLKNLAEY